MNFKNGLKKISFHAFKNANADEADHEENCFFPFNVLFLLLWFDFEHFPAPLLFFLGPTTFTNYKIKELYPFKNNNNRNDNRNK